METKRFQVGAGMAALFLAFLTVSCSSEKVSSVPGAKDGESSCSKNSLAAEHVSISSHANSSKFNGCFLNHLRLNGLDALEAKICAYLVIRPNGEVSHAKVKGLDESLSTDLRWCLEQEFWKMNYSGLQFDVSQKIKFPISFKVERVSK